MTRWQSAPTTYFNGEGRAFMQECLGAAFKSAVEREAKTIVIFTGSGKVRCLPCSICCQR